MKIKDIPKDGRPREKFVKHGPEVLSHAELMAIMLSAQTTDASVNRVTPALFNRFRTLSDLAHGEIDAIESIIKYLGSYKNKAKNLKAMGNMILNEFQGVIPQSQDGLESLPGVGRKTANVFLSEWYKIPRIAVDTHVKRLARVLSLSKETNPDKIEQDLMKIIPKKEWFNFTYRLINYGRTHCPAKKHDHEKCPLRNI